MLTAAILGLTLFQTPAQEPKKDPLAGLKLKTYQFVALRKGLSPVAMTAEAAQRAQKTHLEVLERLWLVENKAVLLGPFTDDGDIRGIAFLETSAEEAKQIFDADPLVRAGALRAEIRPVMAAEGFLRKPPKFLDLMPYTFGFYKRPEGELPRLEPEVAQGLQRAHLENNQKMADVGALVWAGPFLDNTSIRGMLVFRWTDLEKIRTLVAEDALVKAGRLVLELHPAITAKGAFPPFEPKSGG